VVARLDMPPGYLNVSPDGQTVLFAASKSQGRTLMMIENFR